MDNNFEIILNPEKFGYIQCSRCEGENIMNKNFEKINLQIKENELSAIDWELNSIVWELYWWVDLFQMVFFKDMPVPLPVLTFERKRVNSLGYYCIGRNDFAIREQINLNRSYLDNPLWSILVTLLHMMVHSWEFTYVSENKRTKSWYHGKTFRDKMAEFGIICSNNGNHAGLDSNGLFVFILKKHAINFDDLPENNCANAGIVPINSNTKIKGKSKLKKWTCACQIVRVGKKYFKATCDICGKKFELDE